MSVDDDARCDRVGHGWIGALHGLPIFRPSGVPECCGVVMRFERSSTGWDGPIERQTVQWVCEQCRGRFTGTFSMHV